MNGIKQETRDIFEKQILKEITLKKIPPAFKLHFKPIKKENTERSIGVKTLHGSEKEKRKH